MNMLKECFWGKRSYIVDAFEEIPDPCLLRRHFLEIKMICPISSWLGFAVLRVGSMTKILDYILEKEHAK